MHKRNGFTLVELMAVIVIMSIIILIAVPAYSNISKSIQKRNYDQQIKYIELQAEKFITNEHIVSSHDEFEITVGTLVHYDYLDSDSDTEEEVLNPMGDSIICNVIKINLKNGAPEATFTETSNCVINTETYVDSIIKLIAYQTVNNTKKVIGYSQSNDTNTIVLDRRLNWVNSDIVLMLTIPNDSKFSANDITKVTWHDANNNLILEKNDWLDSIDSLIEGRINDSNPNNDYKNVYKISNSSIMNDTKYRVSVSLEYFDDNNVKKVENLSTYVIIRIDKQPPTVSAIADETWGPKAKNIYITGSDKEGSGISHFYINTENTFNNCKPLEDTKNDKNPLTTNAGCEKIEITKNKSNNTATIQKYKGNYYIWAVDYAGNISLNPAFVSVFNIDSTPPTCIYSGESTDWIKGSRTITVGCEDSESGCEIEYNKKFTFNSGTIKQSDIEYTISDNAGNTTKCAKKANVYIDNEAPSCSLVNEAPEDGWSNSRTILLQCNDTGSGCTENTYNRVFGKNATIDADKNVTATNVTKDFTDKVGNSMICEKRGVKVLTDTIPPTCSYEENSTWKREATNVYVKCSDTGSGCKQSKYPIKITQSTYQKTLNQTISDKSNNTTLCNGTVSALVDLNDYSCEIKATGTMGDNNYYISDVSLEIELSGNNGDIPIVGTPSFNDGTIKETESVNGKYKVATVSMASGVIVACNKTLFIDKEPPTVIANYFDNITKLSFADNIQLNKYVISTSAEVPSSWNKSISGTISNIDYDTPNSGKFYAHVKDKAGLTNYLEFINPNLCSVTPGQEWNFSYTNTYQEFKVPCNGKYELEVISGKGGNAGDVSYPESNGYQQSISCNKIGSNGSAASGTFNLTANTQLYVVTGGESTGCSWKNGSDNGGCGSAYSFSQPGFNGGVMGTCVVGGSGGATHIGKIKELINTISDENLIISANGGQGAREGKLSGGKNYYNSSLIDADTYVLQENVASGKGSAKIKYIGP